MSAIEVDQQPVMSAGDIDLLPLVPSPREVPLVPTIGKSKRIRADLWSRLQLVIRWLAPSLLYLGVRGIGLLILAWFAAQNQLSMFGSLTSWDGQWYLGIAAHGYHGVPADLVDAFNHRDSTTALAFFPGYPLATRLVTVLPGVSVVSAAFAVSIASGLFIAHALTRIGQHINKSRRVGLVLTVLFAASPMGIVLAMTYSEALFCAMAAWALVGLLERRWLLAGLCAMVAGLMRPTAAALVITVFLAAVVAIVRRRDNARPWAAVLLAPSGLVGYLAFVAYRTGNLAGWFAVQEQGWNSRFDGGLATMIFSLQVLASGRSAMEVATVAFLLIAIVLVILAVRQRVAWPLVVYGILVLLMDVCSNGVMTSKARMLLPAFTLLIPAAYGLAYRKRSTMIITLVAVVLAGAWFGDYAITSWQYAI